MQTGYDVLGRRVAETNEASIVTRFGYDSLGRLIAVTNAFGQPEQTLTQYAYDETGGQTNQVDALGRITAFAYDALGRRVKRTLPGNQSEGFAYDAAGSLLAQTNFNGQVITNKYDSMSRLLSRWHGGTNLESYVYDAAGRLANRTDLSGSFAWTFDSLGRVTANSTPVGTLVYQYDAAGNLTNLASLTSGGASVGYQYDALNRLTNVIDQRLTGTKNTAYTFDLVGNLAALSYPNGVTNLWQYDTRNRLTNEVWKLTSTSLASFLYQVGVAGNRTNLSDTVNGSSRTFSWSYDNLYRLTNETIGGATPTGTISYKFDPVGNRTNRTSGVTGVGNQTPTYNTNDWLNSDSYDNNGNTTNSSSVAYLYDYANRLTNANGGTVQITYGADGNRIKKVAGGVTTLYLVDSRNLTGYAQVVEELTVSGGTNLAKVYTYGLDLISQRVPNTSTNFFGYDGQGSTRFLLNAGGTLTEHYAYDAYGTLIASNTTPESWPWLRTKANLTYIRLNIQTPCPPRGDVPVNQGRDSDFLPLITRGSPRSWMRLPRLCRQESFSRELMRQDATLFRSKRAILDGLKICLFARIDPFRPFHAETSGLCPATRLRPISTMPMGA